MGVPVSGWDPAYFPDEERTPADVVNLGYVVNVIEDLEERAVALCAAWELAQKLLIVSARLEWEAQNVAGDFQGDGIVTSKRTFQKFYAQDELRDWIQATTGRSCVAAAPGVFYVFRETSDEQAFTANRLTQPRRVPTVRLSEEDFKRHQDLLQPLMEFISRRGRLPIDLELDVAPQIREHLRRHAESVLVRFAALPGLEQWEAIRHEHVATTCSFTSPWPHLENAPRLGQLPDALRYDIRAFFGTYKAARAEADALLFSAGDQDAISRTCGQAPVGKILPDALYAHHTALPHLPPLLRVYEGCGRQLAGSVDDLTLVKLSRQRPQVSYLLYPDFDRLGHPALTEAFIADLSRLALYHRDYRRSENPPVLHRKELLLSADHPLRQQCAQLTKREEDLGLLAPTHRTGFLDDWHALLKAKGLYIRGHRIIQGQPPILPSRDTHFL